MMLLANLIILGLAASAFSTTVASSRLFKPLRLRIHSRSNWWGDLVGCSYCLGHWAAIMLVLATSYGSLVEMIIAWLAVTAISALASGTIGRLHGD